MQRPKWKLYSKTGWQPYGPSNRCDGVIEQTAAECAARHDWVVAIEDFHTGELLWPAHAMAAE
ncbi:hypothetical protein JF540_22775 [Salipiger thiooxidans]|uniref:hypothetical protein n=1 Tax=Salipiger thiooxidans TaxID=282683 RepID=UPI001A8CFA0F|nr:hypothetical protein [Salipiger thiooxidans]MBN8189514.1 hypothetical protein [Salipiger thiooxidans]